MRHLSRHLFLLLFLTGAISARASAQTDFSRVFENAPVLMRGASGQWDDTLLAGPCVLLIGDTYHMWYAGYDGSTGTRIGHAVSSDGVNWTKDTANNPVLEFGPAGSWDQTTVYQPSVVFDGSGYHMWYGGHDTGVRRIGYATSPDGITWTKHDDASTVTGPYSESDPVLDIGPSGTWEDAWVDSPEVLLIEGVFHMWYSGNDATSSDRYTRTGHATSTDGITWVKDDLNPILDVGSPGNWDDIMSYQPAVLHDETSSLFHMYYSGGAVFAWRIGHASSSDGRIWTKDDDPVLDVGVSTGWESQYVGLAGAAFNADSSMVQLWYSGGSVAFQGDIGLATAPNRGIVDAEDAGGLELPPGFALYGNYPNPFNPTTTISYALPTATELTLTVVDLLGREVRALAAGIQPGGRHDVRFDASGMPSGVYFYRLVAGDRTETRAMVLLR